MNGISLYIISTVAAVALASFASLNKKMSDAIRPTLGIILLAALISPLPDMISGLGGGEIELPPQQWGENITETAAEDAFCRGVAAAVADKFSLDRGSLAVECVGFSFSEMRAELIRVELSGKAIIADRIGIKDYIERSGLGNCEVVILLE